jgi:hypothetical protein
VAKQGRRDALKKPGTAVETRPLRSTNS